MYCSRDYQLTSRFNQQYEKSTWAFKIWAYVNQGIKETHLAIPFKGFPSGTSGTSSGNGGYRRGFLTRCIIARIHYKDTVISTSRAIPRTDY